MAGEEAIRHEFVVGLRNAHALEHKALSLLDRQIEHLAEYAEVKVQLRSHRGETERQIERLETILASPGESHSALKDVAASLGGNLAALGHTFAPDEILKNSFANFAFGELRGRELQDPDHHGSKGRIPGRSSPARADSGRGTRHGDLP